MKEFLKMHGAGNDFVVLDARKERLPDLDYAKLAHRQFGVGADQIIILKPSKEADVFMQIINADGSEVSACGNATRCVAWLLMQERGTDSASIETKADLLHGYAAGERKLRVRMGQPRFGWQEIPLAEECDTNALPILHEALPAPVAISMGNPHAVFFVEDLSALDVATLGAALENHPIFPERANISFAQITGKDSITLRVWERGAGLTLACGTAACATAVAAYHRGLSGRNVSISLPGGVLDMAYDDGFIWMAGPVEPVFEGRFTLEDFAKTA